MLKGDMMDSLHAYRALFHVALSNAGGSMVISNPDLKRALKDGTAIQVEKIGNSEDRVFRLVHDVKQVRK